MTMRGLAVAAVVALLTQAPAPSMPSTPTDVEQLRAQLNQALDELAIARAQRANCETVLGPLEAKTRGADSEQRWAALKADLEKARPGFDCDPHTGICTKKPDPPKPKDGSQ